MTDMTDLTVIEGRFWLPGDRHRSHGRIEHSVRDGVTVHLVDTNLTSRTAARPRGPEPIDVLHGETLGGTPLTLLGVYPTHWQMLGVGPSAGDVVDAFAMQMLKGVHVMDANDFEVLRTGVCLHGLRELLTGGTIDHGPLQPAHGEASSEHMTVRLDGAELSLVASRQTSLSRTEERSQLRASAGFSFVEPQPLSSIRSRYISALEDLVLFATRHRTFVTDWNVDYSEDPWSTVEIFARGGTTAVDEREVYALALNLADQEDPAGLIARWFELRENVGPVWNVFFAALERSESLLEDRLLGLLSFAEGYHRTLHDRRPLTNKQQKSAEKAIKAGLTDPEVRKVYKAALSHANQQTQRERLEMLTERALEVVGSWWYVDVDVFLSRLIHTRNRLVHWGKPGKDTVDDGGAMIDLVQGLIVVLYVNILRDLGLSEDDAARVIGSGWRLEGPPADVFREEPDDEAGMDGD